jgi:hypothetical protein
LTLAYVWLKQDEAQRCVERLWSSNVVDISIDVIIKCKTTQEAGGIVEAIRAHLGGQKPKGGEDTGPPVDATTVLSDRLEVALRGAPPNQQKNLLLQLLFDAAADEWVPFDKIKKAFTKARLKATQAAAALRDLSWQMRQFLPPEDITGLDAFICILAERTRSSGSFNYRLTKAGRMAVGRFLSH